MYWLILIPVILFIIYFSYMFYASGNIRSGVYLKTLYKGDTTEKKVCITFDDGPSELSEKVLGALRKHNAKATFFLIGNKVAQNPETVRKIVADGHLVGAHTWSHTGKFTVCKYENAKIDIERGSEEITRVCGKQVKLFRPPFGVTNPNIAKAVKETGHIVIGWNVRMFDTIPGISIAFKMRRLISKVRPGSVIQLHDKCRNADIIVDEMLTKLANNGYKIVSLEEMFNIEAYETVK